MNILNRFVLFVFVTLSALPAFAGNSGFATVLIDMQQGFYQRGGVSGSPKLEALVRNQARLLAWSVRKGIPVVVLQYQGFGETDPRLMKIVKNGAYKVIWKNNDGGFYGMSHDELLATLKGWKVDSLIVAGINGAYCVRSTIQGALENKYNVMSTNYVIGNINQNPPIFPNGSWYYYKVKLTIFPTLESIIGPSI